MIIDQYHLAKYFLSTRFCFMIIDQYHLATSHQYHLATSQSWCICACCRASEHAEAAKGRLCWGMQPRHLNLLIQVFETSCTRVLVVRST